MYGQRVSGEPRSNRRQPPLPLSKELTDAGLNEFEHIAIGKSLIGLSCGVAGALLHRRVFISSLFGNIVGCPRPTSSIVKNVSF